MILNVNDERALATPTEAQLEAELAGMEEDSFLILGRADQEYLQTYREEDGSYAVEYRDGSVDKHYGAELPGADLLILQRIFAAYFEGKASWKAMLDWEKVDFDEDFQGDEGLGELPTPE